LGGKKQLTLEKEITMLQAIRNIDTLKVIGTIGPRESIGNRLGDNSSWMPDVGQQIAIRGRQFLGFDSKNGVPVPQFHFPEPRFFKVVAVTPYCAYVTKVQGKKWLALQTRSEHTGTYVGRIPALKGERALLQVFVPSGGVRAQFNRMDLELNGVLLSHGWHEFKLSDFRLETRLNGPTN